MLTEGGRGGKGKEWRWRGGRGRKEGVEEERRGEVGKGVEEERGEALGRDWREGNGGGEGEKRRRGWRSIFIHAKRVV